MSNFKAVVREIESLTSKMIEVGLCVELNFPSQKPLASHKGTVNEITISGLEETSVALRNRSYSEIYSVLREKRAFNMRLIDGAMVQFRYRFRQDKVVKHVLSFFPSPDLLEYQNDPDVYKSDILYAEVIVKNTVTTPVRFDFDPESSIDYCHPASHFTVGQYKNCRIPVLGALTPHRFLNFILRAFYNTAFHEYCSEWENTVPDFAPTITRRERSDLYWSFDQ